MREQLSYLSYFTPFDLRLNLDGGLVELQDEELLALAGEYGTQPLMHLSTLTEDGGFSNDRASLIFNDPVKQERLIGEILDTLRAKGYRGLDVDFEFIYPGRAV